MAGGGGKLPKGFDFLAYHEIRLTNNAGIFEVWIDDIRVTAEEPIHVDGLIPGRPGLLSEGASAAYDATLYTIGWDEYGDAIHGWRDLSSSEPVHAGETGLVLDGSDGYGGSRSGVQPDLSRRRKTAHNPLPSGR